MTKCVKIIYEDVTMSNGKVVSNIVSRLVPFSELNTVYTQAESYTNNFERFVHDCFECGAIYVTAGIVIPIWLIKKMEAHDPSEVPPQQTVSKNGASGNKQKKSNPKRYKNRKRKDIVKPEVKETVSSDKTI